MAGGHGRLKRIWVVGLLPAGYFLYLYLYPVARIVGLTVDRWREALEIPGLARIIGFTVGQAILSTLLTVLIGLPLTGVLSRNRVRGRRWIEAVLTMPFILPTVVVGAAFVAMGFKGSWWGIIIAHIFYNLAIMVRTVGAVWSDIAPEFEQAAATLGASPLRRLTKVTLPMLGPSIAAAASLIFLFTFTSFGVVLILGGLRFATIEVAIWREATGLLRLGAASVLALIQLSLVAIVLYFYARLQAQRSVGLRLTRLHPLRRPQPLGWSLLGIGVGISVVPLVILGIRSLIVGGQWSVVGWQTAGRPLLSAAVNSVLFALVATSIAITVGTCAAWLIANQRTRLGSFFDVLVMLPLGTSAVTIGFGFLVALDRPVDLRGSWLVVPLAHSLVATPFVVRIMLPAMRAIRGDLKEAAAVLGASPRRVWRKIELPLTSRALGAATGFAAAISLGEFGATAFVVRPNSTTLPALVFRALGRPGPINLATAMAAATVLLLLAAGVMFAADRGGQRL